VRGESGEDFRVSEPAEVVREALEAHHAYHFAGKRKPPIHDHAGCEVDSALAALEQLTKEIESLRMTQGGMEFTARIAELESDLAEAVALLKPRRRIRYANEWDEHRAELEARIAELEEALQYIAQNASGGDVPEWGIWAVELLASHATSHRGSPRGRDDT